MKQAISSTREGIKVNETESREIRKKIHASKGKERWDLWIDKRELGDQTRYMLLAYAFLRGVPYQIVEQKCGVGNEPSRCALHAHIFMRFANKEAPEITNLSERVKVWLERPKPTEAKLEAA